MISGGRGIQGAHVHFMYSTHRLLSTPALLVLRLDRDRRLTSPQQQNSREGGHFSQYGVCPPQWQFGGGSTEQSPPQAGKGSGGGLVQVV